MKLLANYVYKRKYNILIILLTLAILITVFYLFGEIVMTIGFFISFTFFIHSEAYRRLRLSVKNHFAKLEGNKKNKIESKSLTGDKISTKELNFVENKESKDISNKVTCALNNSQSDMKLTKTPEASSTNNTSGRLVESAATVYNHNHIN